MQPINPTLIADIGAGDGDDTQFYLRKGFDVVTLEADPVMHARLQERFAVEIAAGSVVLLNQVATDVGGQQVQFWRNELYQGLSTFDYATAMYQEHLVPCAAHTANWQDIVALRGVPYYCKVDIEGGEARFLRSILGSDAYPTYISAECHTFEPIEVLFELGYRRFKLVNQAMIETLVHSIPNPPLEGNYVPDPAWRHGSGPFGRELPDRWMSIQETEVIFDMLMRLKTFRAIGASCWFDCHACRVE
jgi:FkbM family methyltransferase